MIELRLFGDPFGLPRDMFFIPNRVLSMPDILREHHLDIRATLRKEFSRSAPFRVFGTDLLDLLAQESLSLTHAPQ